MFVAWTVLVSVIDVQPVGPQGSSVGFATFNGFFHDFTGTHISLYIITDYMSIIPLGFIAGFALLGLFQLIKRKKLSLVDRDILILGGFYVVVMAVFVFFEIFVINYRPILIEGVLEASYPSSTTMLVMCVMPTSAMQIYRRTTNSFIRRCTVSLLSIIAAFMVVARVISGVHWITDIIGGILVSTGLVMMYNFVCGIVSKKLQ